MPAAHAILADIGSYLAREASPANAAGFLDDMRALIVGLLAFPKCGGVPNNLEALGVHEFRQAGIIVVRRVACLQHGEQMSVAAMSNTRHLNNAAVKPAMHHLALEHEIFADFERTVASGRY